MKLQSKLFIVSFIIFQYLHAQDTLKVLFLGNSYTSFNNLPVLVQNLSGSAGKTLFIDSNMPGGMTISGHLNDPTSLSKLNQGNWDYVIIQEQSQIPTIDYYRYNDMFPALASLKALVMQTNPCTRIITYMTWGRRFGGQQCDPTNTYCSPVFSDFNHMQDSLTSAYTEISDMLQLQCAPVGVTWQNILNDTTLVLHSGDNSHPNLDGSYVAALTIYSAIWKQPSNGITYNAGIAPSLAQYYQQMSDFTVFNNPGEWNLYINNPVADFTFSILNNTVTFNNTSSSSLNNQLTYNWNFDDGNTSNLQNPTHTYLSNGTYNVKLIVSDCSFSDTVSYIVQIGHTNLEENETIQTKIYPNPFTNEITLSVDNSQIGSNFVITDLSGRVAEYGKLNTKLTQIDLHYLPAGLYMITYGKESQQRMRLIKN